MQHTHDPVLRVACDATLQELTPTAATQMMEQSARLLQLLRSHHFKKHEAERKNIRSTVNVRSRLGRKHVAVEQLGRLIHRITLTAIGLHILEDGTAKVANLERASG